MRLEVDYDYPIGFALSIIAVVGGAITATASFCLLLQAPERFWQWFHLTVLVVSGFSVGFGAASLAFMTSIPRTTGPRYYEHDPPLDAEKFDLWGTGPH